MHKLVVNGLYLFSIKEKKAKYVSFDWNKCNYDK